MCRRGHPVTARRQRPVSPLAGPRVHRVAAGRSPGCRLPGVRGDPRQTGSPNVLGHGSVRVGATRSPNRYAAKRPCDLSCSQELLGLYRHVCGTTRSALGFGSSLFQQRVFLRLLGNTFAMSADLSSSSPAGMPPSRPANPAKQSGTTGTPEEVKWTVRAVLASLLVVLIYSLHTSNRGDFLAVLAVGLALALSALLAGGFLGFLFGVPRAASAGNETDSSNNSSGDYRPNTNLEQISDWLTKILVGVGLTQIGRIPSGLAGLVDATGPSLGSAAGREVFAGAILALFTPGGFLAGYILTRIHLPHAFSAADRRAIEKVARTEARRETASALRDVEQRQDEQAHRDAYALALTDQALNPASGAPSVSQEDLDKAIAGASPIIAVQIFSQAREKRRAANWRTTEGKAIVERTLPVFRSLLKATPPVPEHRLFGQLGFAMKDTATSVGDYAEAESLLSRAIELRNEAGESGYLLYEFNRAECRIRQDRQFASQLGSSAEQRAAILADMREAARNAQLHRALCSEEPFATWLRINNVSCDSLG